MESIARSCSLYGIYCIGNDKETVESPQSEDGRSIQVHSIIIVGAVAIIQGGIPLPGRLRSIKREVLQREVAASKREMQTLEMRKQSPYLTKRLGRQVYPC